MSATHVGRTGGGEPALRGLEPDRLAALRRRAQTPSAQVADALAARVAAFRSADRRAIEEARRPLAALGPAAMGTLLELLVDGDGDIAGNALVCLYWLAPNEAFPIMVDNLSNDAPCFIDADQLGETVGVVTWVFLRESIPEWPFASIPRRVPPATRRDLQPRLRAWFATIDGLQPRPLPREGWPRVSVVEA